MSSTTTTDFLDESGDNFIDDDDDNEDEEEQDSAPSTPLSNATTTTTNNFTGSIFVNGSEPDSKRQKTTTNVAHQINIGGNKASANNILSTDQQQLAVRTIWSQTDDLKTLNKEFSGFRKTITKCLDEFQTALMALEAEQQRQFQENFQEARMKMRALQQLEQAQEQAKAARLQRTSLATSQFVSSSSSKKQ